MNTTSTDIHVWALRLYEGAKAKTYTVRWSVDGRHFSKTHKTKAAAERQRVELGKAARRGMPFDIYSGLPVTLVQQQIFETTWYDHAVAFMDMKCRPSSRVLAEPWQALWPR